MPSKRQIAGPSKRAKRTDLWNILLRLVTAADFPQARTISSANLRYKVQVFELLVTETLAYMLRDLSFEVTRGSKDGGIDFVARGRSYEIAPLYLHMETLIKGQVKRRMSEAKLVDALTLNFRSVGDHVGSGMFAYVVVYSTDKNTSPNQIRAKLKEGQADRFYNGPVVYLDADEFFGVWCHGSEFVRNTLHGGLSPQEIERLIGLIEERVSERSGAPIFCTRLNATRLTEPMVSRGFSIQVTLADTHFAVPASVFLRWDPCPRVRLKRPKAVLQPRGAALPLDVGDGGVTLEFVADRAGEVDLGMVRLIDIDGNEWASTALGTLNVAPGPLFVDPPEYKDAFEHERRILDLAACEAEAKHPRALILVGHGGVGKTRLIENVLIDLEAKGFATLAIEHEASLDVDRPFLRELFRRLVRVPETGTGTQDQVLDWAERTISLGRDRIRQNIGLLYGADGEISARHAAELLFAAIADRTRHGPVALHLSNLHWAGPFEIATLEELFRILFSKDIALRSGVLWILEGRTAEQLGLTEEYRAPEAWQRLLDANLCPIVPLRSWSDPLSHGFVEFVLDSIRFLGPDHDRERIIAWALRYGAGNPMYLLECLRALPWQATADGGTALQSPPQSTAPQETATDLVESRPDRRVDQAIELRVRFAACATPDAVAVLAVAARFGAVVEPVIWECLCAVTDSSALKRQVQGLDVADLSVTTRGLRFRHENYHHAFLHWPIPQDCPFRQAVLDWIAQQTSPTVSQLLGEADLLTTGPISSEWVRGHLLARLDSPHFPEEGLARATMLRFILRLSRGLIDQGAARSFHLRHELARALSASADWRQAQTELEALIEDIDQDGGGEETALTRARAAASLGNMLGDLPQTSRGIAAVRRGIDHARATMGSNSEDPAVQTALETLWNRFGILHWFEGRPEQGTRWQWHAFRSARRNDPGGPRDMLFTNEFAMPLLHRHPRRSRQLLEYAAGLVDRLGDGASATSDYILVQSQIAALVTAVWSGEPDQAPYVQQRCREILARPNRKRSVYGQALGHLTAGAAAAVQGRLETAEEHFSESAWISKQAAMSRVFWKAQLNLAQVMRMRDPEVDVSARIAAVSVLLAHSLSRVSEVARRSLLCTWELPMRQCLRLGPTVADSLCALLGDGPPSWGPDWTHRPPCYSKAGEPMQIIHVRREDADFFLMA